MAGPAFHQSDRARGALNPEYRWVGSTLHAAAHKRTEVIVPEALAKALPAAVPLVRGDVGKFLGKAGLHRSVEVAPL
jgi:hypothetical protein